MVQQLLEAKGCKGVMCMFVVCSMHACSGFCVRNWHSSDDSADAHHQIPRGHRIRPAPATLPTTVRAVFHGSMVLAIDEGA